MKELTNHRSGWDMNLRFGLRSPHVTDGLRGELCKLDCAGPVGPAPKQVLNVESSPGEGSSRRQGKGGRLQRSIRSCLSAPRLLPVSLGRVLLQDTGELQQTDLGDSVFL
jgi:hypothetical protein